MQIASELTTYDTNDPASFVALMTYHHFCTDTRGARWQIPEMDNPIFRENLSYIQADRAREAYRLLAKLAVEDGLEIAFVPSATNRTMKLMGSLGGRFLYLFSADRARRYFSFYIRSPAIDHWPELLNLGAGLGGEVAKDSKQVLLRVTAPDQMQTIWNALRPRFAKPS